MFKVFIFFFRILNSKHPINYDNGLFCIGGAAAATRYLIVLQLYIQTTSEIREA